MVKRPGPTRPRAWEPMRRSTPYRSAAAKQALIDEGMDPEMGLLDEQWKNDRYVVSVRRHPEEGYVIEISIRRVDRGYARDWRDFQRIKNEVAGPEIEAIELFPAESRLFDTANQYWLWCFPPGEQCPCGWPERHVTGSAAAERFGARQREIPDGYDTYEEA